MSHALDLFNIKCIAYSDPISKGEYDRRNPCRVEEIGLTSAVAQIEEKSGDSKLLSATRGFLDTCKRCPYR